jgi:WD40 repeat protein
LNYRYSIQCIDLATGKELWHTPSQHDTGGPTTLDISPDGRVLASGSGFTDPLIRVWNAATGDALKPIDGHTACVYDLAFTRDGRHLISAAGDQTIRFWDTNAWTETQVLRGHTDEVWGFALSESAQLIASVSKDGDLKLWTKDGKRAADGYRRLTEAGARIISEGIDKPGHVLDRNDVQPLDHSRVLLLPPGRPPELVDLKRHSLPVPLPEIGSSTNVLGCFGANLLGLWNGTNQILVGELRAAEFVQHGAITLDSGMRPTGVAYNAARQLLAWTEVTSSKSLYLASLAAPGHRIELTNDVPGLVPFRFSGEGSYLAGATKGQDSLRVWNVESGQIVAPINQNFSDACFAANGSVLVVALHSRLSSEIGFYDLARPDRVPQRVPGGFRATGLAVSPDGGLVSAATLDGRILLLDPAMGKSIAPPLRGLLIPSTTSAFSPDGRRLISAFGGQEAVKLWDVGTRQELLTLVSIDLHTHAARWSADGNVILAGPPWQAWTAPSWEEIDAAEAKEKMQFKQP